MILWSIAVKPLHILFICPLKDVTKWNWNGWFTAHIWVFWARRPAAKMLGNIIILPKSETKWGIFWWLMAKWRDPLLSNHFIILCMGPLKNVQSGIGMADPWSKPIFGYYEPDQQLKFLNWKVEEHMAKIIKSETKWFIWGPNGMIHCCQTTSYPLHGSNSEEC